MVADETKLNIMKVKTILVILFLAILSTFFFIDRNIWMKKRVLNVKVWEYDDGDVGFYTRDSILRGLLYTDDIISFRQDTIVFKNKFNTLEKYDTLVMKWSYFGKLRIVDPKNNKTATYIIFNKI